MAQNNSKRDYSSSEDEEEEASGSEDEQTSGSESEEVSDSSSEEKQKQAPKTLVIPPPQSAIKRQAPDSSSSGTEESSSDADSDLPPKKSSVSDLIKIKPISSKPMDPEVPHPELKLVKKSGSTPSPAKSKRASNTPAPNEKDPKKAKINTATEDDSKKTLFQRLWSEDDEIVILQGMIDFKTEKHGENPIADTGAFHEFIKKSLHVDVSRAQLVDKIRRLKKKYVNNASREKNGKDRSFSKSHEQKGYELSKQIWGSGGDNIGTGTESKKNGNAASNSTPAATMVKSNGVDDTMEVEKKMDISRFVQYGGKNDSPVLPEEIVKAGMELLQGSKRAELEERWSNLKKQELELYLKKMDLVRDQALIVLESVNSSGK